jgi:hypothetical protein
MSDSMIPGQGTAVLEPPAAEPVQEGNNRAKLLAGAGLALVVVLGLVAYFVLFAGGGDDTAPTGGTGSSGSPAVGAPGPAEPAPAAVPAKRKRLTQKSFGRDPFKPLVVPAEAAVSTTTGGDTTGTPSGTDQAAGEVSAPEASSAHSFRVIDVAPDNSTVTVKVDGETYRNLEAGDVFAEHFKVLLISGQVNSFQYGEEKFNVIGDKKLTIA